MGAHHSEPTGAYEMYVPNPPKPKGRPFIIEAIFLALVFAAGFAAHFLLFRADTPAPYSTPNTTGVTSNPASATPAVTETMATKTFDDKGSRGRTAIAGTDIATGTWRTTTVDGCIWQVYGKDSAFINGNAGGGKQIAVLRTGYEFDSQGCGIWTRD